MLHFCSVGGVQSMVGHVEFALRSGSKKQGSSYAGY